MALKSATALRLLVVTALAVQGAAGTAQAQYPSQTIQLVVPAAAGGSTDLFARTFSARLAARLEGSVVIVNKGGGGGTIGTGDVAKAVPDGHTLLMGTTGNLVINPLTMSGLGFDARKDLLPVAVLATVPFCVAVNAKFPAASVAEMVAVLKANPGKFFYATNGPAGFIHLTTELFRREAGVAGFTQVPYEGGSSPHQDLIAGVVQVYFDALNASLPLLRGGRLRILATTGAHRSPAAPELPTVAESGLQGVVSETAFVLVAPAGTAPPVVERLSAHSAAIMADPEFQRALQASAIDAVQASDPARARQFLEREFAKWAPVAREVLGR